MKYKKKIDEIIRVDLAGEKGAIGIYKGQLAIIKDKSFSKEINKMLKKEEEHFKKFSELLIKYRVRPTVLDPLWEKGAFGLGLLSAALGKKAAMACTEAVEEVIVDHYNAQIKYLESLGIEKEMLKKIKKFCADEDDHRSFAEQSNLNDQSVNLFKSLTKNLTRLAIRLSKKI